MKYLNFDKDTGEILGWYAPDVHGDNIPSGCVEVEDSEWEVAIGINANHFDALTEVFSVQDFRSPTEKLEAEQEQFRMERNLLLEEADHRINTLLDKGLDASEWRAYRIALRDSTETWVLPEKPEWML